VKDIGKPTNHGTLRVYFMQGCQAAVQVQLGRMSSAFFCLLRMVCRTASRLADYLSHIRVLNLAEPHQTSTPYSGSARWVNVRSVPVDSVRKTSKQVAMQTRKLYPRSTLFSASGNAIYGISNRKHNPKP
jgi:hypothetical protein